MLGLPNVDVGQGWLIFGLPPSEVAVHPSDKNDMHEFYLMCTDVKKFIAAMDKRGVRCGPVQNQGWGLLTQVSLPGGGRLGVYQPRHARPEAISLVSKPKAAGAPARMKKAPAAKTPARKRPKRSAQR